MNGNIRSAMGYFAAGAAMAWGLSQLPALAAWDKGEAPEAEARATDAGRPVGRNAAGTAERSGTLTGYVSAVKVECRAQLGYTYDSSSSSSSSYYYHQYDTCEDSCVLVSLDVEGEVSTFAMRDNWAATNRMSDSDSFGEYSDSGSYHGHSKGNESNGRFINRTLSLATIAQLTNRPVTVYSDTSILNSSSTYATVNCLSGDYDRLTSLTLAEVFE